MSPAILEAGSVRRAAATAAAVVLSFGAIACGGGDEQQEDAGQQPEATATETIRVPITPTDIPIAVAVDEGLFEGIDVEYQVVGFDAKTPLFLQNKDDDMPVVELSPVEVATEIARGEDIAYFSTADGLYFWNGIVVREEDADRYRTIDDLEGRRIGQPGFSTGTWAAFAAVADNLYGLDARRDFTLVTADPGALLGLLAAGRIDAALTFASQAATGLASDEFELVAPLGRVWQRESGEPLLVGGLAGSRQWLEANPEAAQRFVEGVDRGVQWMMDNPDEFREGGKYAKLAADQGWHSDKRTTDQILELLADGQWYFKSEAFAPEWRQANHRFATLALEAAGTEGEAPTEEQLFFLPEGQE